MAILEDPVSDARFDRYLIRGELRERPKQFRGRLESISLTRALVALQEWRNARPKPRGEVLIDLGYWLSAEPRTAVDIPLAVLSAETSVANPGDVCWIDGRPELAVEILNYREPAAAIEERVAEYLRCGVPLVWLIDPLSDSPDVRVFRPGHPVHVLTVSDDLTADPLLPGFTVPVRELFR